MRMFSDSDDDLIKAIRGVLPDAEIPDDDLLKYAEHVLDRAREYDADRGWDAAENLSRAIQEKKGE